MLISFYPLYHWSKVGNKQHDLLNLSHKNRGIHYLTVVKVWKNCQCLTFDIYFANLPQRRRSFLKAGYFFVFAYSKLTFSFHTYLAEVLVSEVKERRPLFWNCLGSQAVFMWREGVKTWNWLGILQKVSKIYFFQAIIHFTNFNAIISEFGACLAQNNMATEQPYKPRVISVVVKRIVWKLFGRNLLDGMTSRRRGLVA